MKFHWKKSLAVSIVALGLGKIGVAQNSINIVSTAVPFLTISPEARSGAMGNAGIATSPDAFSTFFNNSKAAFATSNAQVGFTYTPWLSDITSDVYLVSLAGYYKPNESSAITGGVRYFNLGNIQLYGNSNEPLGSTTPKEFGIELGYSLKVSEKFGVGFTGRYINSNLGTGSQGNDEPVYKVGNAFAADLSAYYNGLDENGQGFTGGLALTNLGTKISYTTDADSKMFIPANIGIGGAYHAILDEDNKLNFTLDVNHLLVPKALADTTSPTSAAYADYFSTSVVSGWGKSFSNSAFGASFGAEYAYNNMFFLRAGYHAETASQGNMKYFTAGVGIKYNVMNFNFAYLAPSGGSGLNRNPLSNTLRFTLAFDLGSQSN